MIKINVVWSYIILGNLFIILLIEYVMFNFLVSQTLNLLRSESNMIYIMGDFNIDLLKAS